MAAEKEPSWTLEEKLYFGSVECTFGKVAGEVVGYAGKETFMKGGEKEQAAARVRLNPLKDLGGDYAKLIVPAIPTADLVEAPLSAEKKSAALKAMPTVLSEAPLQKKKDGTVIGAHSGIRSGIVRAADGTFYRLKGCGNNYEDFLIREVKGSEGLLEIRGCTFKWTCQLEQYMTGLIHDAIKEEKEKKKEAADGVVYSANEPVGWYIYDVPNDRFPKVLKCCSLFRTHGEKRLGDHVLIGIERLFTKFFKINDIAVVASQFPIPRQTGDDTDGGVMSTWMATLMGADDFGGYVDGLGVKLGGGVEETKLPIVVPDEEEVEPQWKALWDSSMSVLTKFQSEAKENLWDLFMYIGWRFGRAAGEILQAMSGRGISWGTYTDKLGTHCNAHTNNFVILPEINQPTATQQANLLAPLDFDMAFTKDIFLLLSDDNTGGALPEAQFAEWMILESRGLEMCFAGSDLNSGANPVADLPPAYRPLQWVLRDTLCRSFLSGFRSQEDAHPAAPSLYAPMHALIRLALISTAKDIA